MERDGKDLTEMLMEKEKLLLIVSYNLGKTEKKALPDVKTLSENAMQTGYSVYFFSASTPESFEELKAIYGFEFDLLFCDETTLKTIIRSNPGIVTLHKGTITGKWAWRQMDKVKLD